MTEIEQRNPFLARLAIGRGAYQRPPQAQINPYAVQFGQGLEIPYYQPTPQINLNQDAAQNTLGNFFWRNAAANNARPYKNPQYQNVQLSAQGNQAMIPPEARQDAMPYLLPIGATALGVGSYLANQAAQNAFMRSSMGTTPGNVMNSAVYPAAVMATAYLGNRLAAPALNAVNKIANSPVGKWGSKVIDWFF